jgi:glycine/D-amino acid oxidase-like deaminating enzyme
MKRREFLAALGVAPALIGLSRKAPRQITGGFVDDGGEAGHRIRDDVAVGGRGRSSPSEDAVRARIVIVGAGIAGLSAAWELDRRGVNDFVILELEKDPGGNSRSGQNEITAYPWAAHYVPIPDTGATLVRELFEELGVLKNGVWEERYLTFTPHERLFHHGQWHDGIEPDLAVGPATRQQFARFDEEIAKLRDTKQFTIPMARGVKSDSPLDRITMGEWMAQKGFTSRELLWYVDYACRDDYGALARDVSAWAGVHYFASRPQHEHELTWPEGNGWIAKRLASRFARQLVTSEPARRVERRNGRWLVSGLRRSWLADAVIFAAPTYTAPYVIPELRNARDAVPAAYSPWLTANLTLDRWPKDVGRGAGPSWDNVIYDSPSLGYIIATHQSLATRHDRTVWTYYWALADYAPKAGRALLQRRTWNEWTELILADLGKAHPDIRDCVSRIDIMRMGHAMVRPVAGALRNARNATRLERPGLYFANSDLSGLSLFEEAQYRGVMAARRVLAR